MAGAGLDPMVYELHGDGGTQVRYATIDVRGRARLRYAGPHGERTYPDEEMVNLTLLIPPVRVDEEGAAQLETIAVVTTMLSPLTGPPSGQDYRYEVVALRGRALYALS